VPTFLGQLLDPALLLVPLRRRGWVLFAANLSFAIQGLAVQLAHKYAARVERQT
jgi:hypothetical protein